MNSKVKIYASPTCPHCRRLKKFLEENDVKFEYFDVTSDSQARQEMIEISSQMGVPVAVIDGEVIIGFNREKIKKKLGLG